MPTDRLLPWLFAELPHVPAQNVTIINGTGSHRPNTPAEIERWSGGRWRRPTASSTTPRRSRRRSRRRGSRATAARSPSAATYVEADKRIVVGFIEPHFMAGFSGGYKGVFPALADIDSITHYHRAAVIADPKSTWGVLDGNPTQDADP